MDKNENQYRDETEELPQFSAISDADVGQTTSLIQPYPAGSILDMAYGANDPLVMATQLIQGGELYRMSRGYPYKRGGHMVPVFPQFKTQNITIHNLASQPQSNRSAEQITQPTADTSTTNISLGTPTIGRPGFNKLNLT